MPAAQKKDPMEAVNVSSARFSPIRASGRGIADLKIFMVITNPAMFLMTIYLWTTPLCANIARQARQLVLGRVIKENSYTFSMMAAGNITLPLFVFGSRIYAAVYNLVSKSIKNT